MPRLASPTAIPSASDPTCDGPTLSIVIPVKDEKENIATLAAEIDEVMGASALAWEAVWVDDGSTDGTAARIADLGPPHRLLRFDHNQGQSAALFAGFRTARGLWIGTLDGDGQNDPRDLLAQLAHALDHGLDLCNGIRTKRRDSLLRRVSSRLGNAARNWITREDRVRDVGCSTRVFRRELALEIPFFHGAHRFLPTLIRMRGGIIDQIPVNHRPRQAGRSKYGVWNRLWSGLRDCFGVRWLQDRNRVWVASERVSPSQVPTASTTDHVQTCR